MEHRASECVKEQSHAVVPVKAEVDKAAPSATCRGVQTNANFTEEEPGLAELVKREPALLVKEEVVEDGWQDIAELQCGPSTSTIVGCMNVFDSVADLGNTLNIKEELGAIDIGPTVLQLMDTQGTTKQLDVSIIKQEGRIKDNNMNAVLCGGVTEETIEGERRADTDDQRGNMAAQSELRARSQLYSCDKCMKTYASKNSLLVHNESLHSTESHKCTKCNKKFPSKHYLYRHTSYAHSEQQYECAVCKKICRSKQSLTRHVYDVHRPRPAADELRARSQVYRCDKCMKTYASKGSLLVHNESLHSTESHKCTKCNKTFPSKAHLYRHTSTAHSEQQYECAVCTKICRSKRALHNHVYYAHRPRPAADELRARSQLYRCDKCMKTYASKCSLLVHNESLHSTESHKCTKCNKIFPSKGYLYRHTSTAHSEQQYECALCKKIYRSKRSLHNHVYYAHRPRPTVSEPRIHICDYCQKTFSIKATLGIHITKVHASGSYKCSQCNTSFKCEQYLMRHTRRNHPAGSHQLHKCNNCEKNFSSKQYCQQHEKRGKCTRPTAGNTSAAASTSRQQRNVVIVKEEPADGELELGPTVFQHMDCNYRPYKQEPQLD